jgi:uncharacterized protein DUF4136
MSFIRKLALLAAPVALLALSACATPFRADVARFQTMPAPQGQSFVIQAQDAQMQGGLEFNQYASYVGQKLSALGYTRADDPRSATLLVRLDYGVGNAREKVTTTNWGGGWGGWGWGGWGGGFHRGYWGPGWGWGGWGGWGPEVESYTIYDSFLDMTISRTADNQRLFEGHAKTTSTGDDLTRLVPNLVEAMFTNFPGRSGETIRVTVPPPPKR